MSAFSKYPMASYMGTVPIIAGDFSISCMRKRCVFPLFDKSMMDSAPSSNATSTLRHSSASSARSPEMPRLTLTLVRRPSPTPSGESDAWWMFAGMAMRPHATPLRMNSGSRPSLRATSSMCGVITPARANSICVIGSAPDFCAKHALGDVVGQDGSVMLAPFAGITHIRFMGSGQTCPLSARRAAWATSTSA